VFRATLFPHITVIALTIKRIGSGERRSRTWLSVV